MVEIDSAATVRKIKHRKTPVIRGKRRGKHITASKADLIDLYTGAVINSYCTPCAAALLCYHTKPTILINRSGDHSTTCFD
jgi:hypothetical protein